MPVGFGRFDDLLARRRALRCPHAIIPRPSVGQWLRYRLASSRWSALSASPSWRLRARLASGSAAPDDRHAESNARPSCSRLLPRNNPEIHERQYSSSLPLVLLAAAWPALAPVPTIGENLPGWRSSSSPPAFCATGTAHRLPRRCSASCCWGWCCWAILSLLGLNYFDSIAADPIIKSMAELGVIIRCCRSA